MESFESNFKAEKIHGNLLYNKFHSLKAKESEREQYDTLAPISDLLVAPSLDEKRVKYFLNSHC